MAFSVGGSNGVGRGRRRFGAGGGALSEINIVPLVDVVLVLLIIFMLTAHVMEFGLEINVPATREVRDTADDLPVVSITRDAKIYLNESPVNINRIAAEVARRFPGAKAVYIRADAAAVWDPIVQVISVVGKAGLQPRVVTKPEEPAGRGR
jgi:biopolymer transport protein ExbD